MSVLCQGQTSKALDGLAIAQQLHANLDNFRARLDSGDRNGGAAC